MEICFPIAQLQRRGSKAGAKAFNTFIEKKNSININTKMDIYCQFYI